MDKANKLTKLTNSVNQGMPVQKTGLLLFKEEKRPGCFFSFEYQWPCLVFKVTDPKKISEWPDKLK